jgi:hypothetical protein
MSDAVSLLILPGPVQTIALAVLGMVVACVLIIDANWMAALLRNGLESAPPPLFKAPIRIEGRWRRIGYLAIAVLVIGPMFMLPTTGMMPNSSATVIIMVALGIATALTLAAEATGHSVVGSVSATMIVVLLIAPYLVAGPIGWTRYLFIVGTEIAILSLLFTVAWIHKLLFGYRPRSRLGAGARLMVDGGLALAAAIAACWPLYG